MYEVFNMGTGFVVIVESMKEIAEVTAICKKYDIASNVIGAVEPCQGKEVTIPEHGLVGKGQKITSA
jgi:phosphoribosylaminoimidazole (AIR) synthetase